MSNLPFTALVRDAVMESSATSCVTAAKNAMANIFDPPLWRQAFKEFPSKGEKRKHL